MRVYAHKRNALKQIKPFGAENHGRRDVAGLGGMKIGIA
jgi:hypothetical protein